MARLQQIYKEKVVPKLLKEFAYKNVMQVPRVRKITLNMGVGEAVADKKQIENAVRDMTAIAGQKPSCSQKPAPHSSISPVGP